MTEPTDTLSTGERRARDRVGALLAWSREVLGSQLGPVRPCPIDRVVAAAGAQGVAALAPAHEELLLRAGDDQPHSALADLFADDLVGVDAMLGVGGHRPMRAVALDLVEAWGYGLDPVDVVIRVRPSVEVEYVVIGTPDPPVWALAADAEEPVLRHPSFTAWLGDRIVRAAKRRHPLGRVPAPPPAR